jgi:hypothetical protein
MSQQQRRPFTRRELALGLAAASGTALLPLPASAADEPPVEAALTASPAPLDPQQRLAVRNGVRGLQKSLADARKKEVPNDVDPAFVYLPGGGIR